MKISEKGIDLIKEWEGFKAAQYRCPADELTIGYGHTIEEDEKLPPKISEKTAEELLREDLEPVESTIHTRVKVPLKQGEYDALCSLIFNIGSTAFKRSRGLMQLNKGNYEEAAIEFFSEQRGFVRININKSIGLVNRRKAEQALWKIA